MIYESENYKNIRNKTILYNSTFFSNSNINHNLNHNYFPMENNINKNSTKLDGTYKSASITFYCKNMGYLLCMEMRDNKLVYHPIGGKYENKDKCIEKTACREFIEETGILQNNDFMNLLKNKKENAIEYIYHILQNEEACIYYDFYVNKEKFYIHRYYVVDIDKLEDNIKNIIKNLDHFYIDTYKEFKNNDEYILSLHWDKEMISNHLHKKNYSMLTIYLSNLLKK